VPTSGRPPGPASGPSDSPGGDPERRDPRAVWLRSIGWRETHAGLWTLGGEVTSSGSPEAVPLDEAFDVALNRSVSEKAFQVEIADGYVRVALPWRLTAPQDRAGPAPSDEGPGAPRAWSAGARRRA
jgi:hypothetical protein